MRLNINLASQPYQDLRRMVVRWAIALALVALITMGLVYAATSAILSWRSAKYQERELRSQITQRDRIRSDAESFLGRRENRSTRDQSQFLNSLIARKAFSWTGVLTDLEKIVPTGIQVVGIRPEINDEGQLQLHLQVSGSTRAPAIELVRRMEATPRFRDAAMVNETAEDTKEGPKLRFNIVSRYIPAYESAPSPQPSTVAESNPAQQEGAAR